MKRENALSLSLSLLLLWRGREFAWGKREEERESDLETKTRSLSSLPLFHSKRILSTFFPTLQNSSLPFSRLQRILFASHTRTL